MSPAGLTTLRFCGGIRLPSLQRQTACDGFLDYCNRGFRVNGRCDWVFHVRVGGGIASADNRDQVRKSHWGRRSWNVCSTTSSRGTGEMFGGQRWRSAAARGRGSGPSVDVSPHRLPMVPWPRAGNRLYLPEGCDRPVLARTRTAGRGCLLSWGRPMDSDGLHRQASPPGVAVRTANRGLKVLCLRTAAPPAKGPQRFGRADNHSASKQ